MTHERDRFERELHRLRGMHFARVIVTASRDVIAAGAYRSNANPRAVLASCDTLLIGDWIFRGIGSGRGLAV